MKYKKVEIIDVDSKIELWMRRSGLGAIADEIGVSRPYLSMLLSKDRPLPEEMYDGIMEIYKRHLQEKEETKRRVEEQMALEGGKDGKQ